MHLNLGTYLIQLKGAKLILKMLKALITISSESTGVNYEHLSLNKFSSAS